MRHLFYGLLIGVFLATPAAAQSGSAANNASAPSSTPQGQPAKDGKTADQAPKTGQAANDPAPDASRTDSMSNYDVNGNGVGDGTGVSR